MKKQERKENGNKGFSLVELIVVVAIMAVLLVVLTPQYLRYVERTRLQKDNSAIAEIVQTIKIALADETILSDTTFDVTMSLTGTTGDNKSINFSTLASGTDDTQLYKELQATISDEYATSSNTYKESSAAIVLTVTIDNGIPDVTASGWIDSVGGPTGTRTFNATPTFTPDGATPTP